MTLSAFTRSLAAVASVSLILAGAAAAQDQAQPAGQVVEAQSLGALDLWSAPGRDTGLPAGLWHGASAGVVRETLDQIDGRPLSPALAALARRVLATGANAPDGAGNDPVLASLRVRALLALGDASAAQAIQGRAADVESSEAQTRAKAETALEYGRDSEACDAAQALQQGRDAPFELKLRAYCSVLAGQPAAAQVTLDLWRQGGGKDAAFDRLATAASGGAVSKKKPLKASLSDPLNYALSRHLKLDLALDDAAPEVAAAVANDPSASPAVRAEAAARALRTGALSPESVRTIDALAAGGSTATVADLAAKPGAEAEAALSVLASQGADPNLAGQAAEALLKRAKSPYDFIALSRLAAPGVALAVKAHAPVDDPVLFATAAAVAGDTDTAGALRGGIEQDKAPGSGPFELAMLDAIMAVQGGKPAGPVLDRLIERGGVGDAKLRARAQAAALLLAALGEPISDEARAQFAAFDTPAARTDAERALTLARAAVGHRQGEAAIVSVSIGLQQGLGLTPADRALIVGGLHAAGLNGEARAVAVEGLVVLARP
ncbi:MAG TPA: hypothetical protein VGL66_08085 [Caulobacteraceae bacterium]|jgi:hypothetical protein